MNRNNKPYLPPWKMGLLGLSQIIAAFNSIVRIGRSCNNLNRRFEIYMLSFFIPPLSSPQMCRERERERENRNGISWGVSYSLIESGAGDNQLCGDWNICYIYTHGDIERDTTLHNKFHIDY